MTIDEHQRRCLASASLDSHSAGNRFDIPGILTEPLGISGIGISLVAVIAAFYYSRRPSLKFVGATNGQRPSVTK